MSFLASLLLALGAARFVGAGINPAFRSNLTVYHVNPAHYAPAPVDMNTADLRGDIYFDLRTRSLPLECGPWRNQSFWSRLDCSNPEVDSSDLAITKLVLEVDSRCVAGFPFATLAANCPNTLHHRLPKNRGALPSGPERKSALPRPSHVLFPPFFPSPLYLAWRHFLVGLTLFDVRFTGYSDCNVFDGGYFCSCDGQANCSSITPSTSSNASFICNVSSGCVWADDSCRTYSCDNYTSAEECGHSYHNCSWNPASRRCSHAGPPPPTCAAARVGMLNLSTVQWGASHANGAIDFWHLNTLRKMAGTWYDTPRTAQCDPAAPEQACSWRVAEVVKKVNKTCSDASIAAAVTTAGKCESHWYPSHAREAPTVGGFCSFVTRGTSHLRRLTCWAR